MIRIGAWIVALMMCVTMASAQCVPAVRGVVVSAGGTETIGYQAVANSDSPIWGIRGTFSMVITPTHSGTVSVAYHSCYSSNSGNYYMAFFTSNGATRLGVSNANTGETSGTNTYTFSTPVSLSAGVPVRIAWGTDHDGLNGSSNGTGNQMYGAQYNTVSAPLTDDSSFTDHNVCMWATLVY